MADNNAMNEIQLVVFDLASEHYGFDIADVREIMRMQNITKVPGAMSAWQRSPTPWKACWISCATGCALPWM